MSVEAAPLAGNVRCPTCGGLISGEWVQRRENVATCLNCAEELRIWPFAALARERAPYGEPLPLGEGEAACFFHDNKRAERPCDRCGRFLCSLCQLPIGRKCLCPACLDRAEDGVEMPELVARRLSWPKLSLVFGTVPLLPVFWFFWPFYTLTAPAALFAAGLSWSRPASLVNPRRWLGSAVGALGGLIQIGALCAVFYFVSRRS